MAYNPVTSLLYHQYEAPGRTVGSGKFVTYNVVELVTGVPVGGEVHNDKFVAVMIGSGSSSTRT